MGYYNDLCNIAEADLGISNVFNSCNSVSVNDRWRDLITVIDFNSGAKDCIFYYVFHLMKWGVPSDSCPTNLKRLSQAIKVEFERYGQAYSAWVGKFSFSMQSIKDSFFAVDKQRKPETASGQKIHSQQLLSMVNELFENVVLNSDTERSHMYEFLEALLGEQEIQKFNRYTFADETKIYSMIVQKYHIDYSKAPKQFDALFELYCIVICQGKTIKAECVQKKFYSITKCTPELLKVIWPKNTNDRLINLFYYYYDADKIPRSFADSWFSSWLSSYASREIISERRPALRKDVFNAIMASNKQ